MKEKSEVKHGSDDGSDWDSVEEDYQHIQLDELKTLEDLAKLTPEQFEMLIEDLRSWCNWRREIKAGSEILEKV